MRFSGSTLLPSCRFLLVAISMLLCDLAAAQKQPGATPEASPTTLKRAVEKAISQNPEVLFRFHGLKAAEHERRAAEGNWLPKIDIEAAGGAYQYKSPATPSTLNYEGDRASIQLRQMLFDGFATRNDVRRLSYSQQAAYHEFISASNNTTLEVVRAYIDVLRFRELVQLAEGNFATHLEVNDKLTEKVRAGVGRRVDLEQAGGRLALAESNWVTEVSNLHDVSARYQRLVGDTPAESLARLDPLDAYLPIGSDFLKEAIPKNPDFLAAVSTIRAYRADANLRDSANAPTIELRARKGYESNRSGVSGAYHESALELVLNYNLYRGGTDRARIKQYLAKLDSAFDMRDKACRDIWQTGQIAFNDSKRLASQLKLLNQHEISTAKARQAYLQQFDIGQRTLLDLLDTENELYQARRALANAEYDLQLAEVRVLATTGTLLNALKLQAMAAEKPEPTGGAEDDDPLMRCSDRILPQPTLNRTFETRLPASPAPAPKPAPVVPVPVSTPVAPPNTCNQLPEQLAAWIAAWNSKQIPQYLDFYSEKFVPALGLSRKAWEDLRKRHISKAKDFTARISEVTPGACDAKTAEVSFVQEYASAEYSDIVNKTLSMEYVSGRWKILKETVTKGRTF